jgi:hypothetical protein
VRVFSPLQRALDPQLGDDTAMRQLSNAQPDTVLFRLDDVTGLRAALALAKATEAIADQVIAARRTDGGEEEVARQAKQLDLPEHRSEVRRLLSQAVRGGEIFFRGSAYQLAGGESAGEAVRNTLSQLLPSIYPRFAEVPHRLVNEAMAVKAALSGSTINADLLALGVYKADGTLNESHPLVSTLRLHLPLVEQDQPPVLAGDLRDLFEKPPFGWDGNAIKVGLALLLRASACRLIDSGQVITDPSDPRAADLLSKEQSFKSLRVQGVRSEVTIQELMTIRGHLEVSFNIRPPLVAASMSNTLGEQLTGLANRAHALQQWAAVAQCPLPVAFESGTSVVEDLRGSATASVRLARYLEQADRLREYAGLVEALGHFRDAQGALFTQVRDFYNSMVNAAVDLAPLRRFISDYRTLTSERGITTPARWNELVPVYHAARQAVTDQIAAWQQEAQQRLAGLEATLETQTRQAGVPDDKLAQETAALAGLFAGVRSRAERPQLTLAEARSLLATLASAEMAKQMRLQELRTVYTVEPAVSEVHLKWQDVAGRATIRSEEELDAMLVRIRECIVTELGAERTIILE